MNERIRELAAESGIGYLSSVHPSMVERFAELLIRECAGVAEVSMPINSHPDDRLIVKNSVLKQFGLE